MHLPSELTYTKISPSKKTKTEIKVIKILYYTIVKL